MKRALIFSMTVLFAVSVINGQPHGTEKKQMVPLRRPEGNVVSEVAKHNFAMDFGKTSNVSWSRGEMFDEATFIKGSKNLTAYYDIDGQLVGTTELKSFKDLPAKGQEEIRTKYKGYTPGKVIYFADNAENTTDMYIYGNQLDDEDNYFVELAKGPEKIVVRVTVIGEVEYFTKM